MTAAHLAGDGEHLSRPARPLLDHPVGFELGRPGVAHSLTEVHDFAAHTARFGPRPRADGAHTLELIGRIEAAGLTGRGGGHFPVAEKWRAVRVARRNELHSTPIVVANGAEGEPFSAKDAALLQLRPHLVLDGLLLAAEAVHATDCVLWLHEGALPERRAMERAMAQRPDVRPRMHVRTGPDRYLTGESSAVVSALSGGPALPRYRRVPATTSGVHGRPTLVHNVETLARIAMVARGDTAQVSTLLTIAVPPRLTAIEVQPDVCLGDVLAHVAGVQPIQAVLVGGFGGTWVPWSELADVPAAEDALRRSGISLGAGVLAPIGWDECGLERTAEIANYLAESSARQCGPCLFGLRDVADVVAQLADARAGRRDAARLDRFLAEIDGRGACHHPDGAVRMVSSAVRTFGADVAAHLRGRCLAQSGAPSWRGRSG